MPPIHRRTNPEDAANPVPQSSPDFSDLGLPSDTNLQMGDVELTEEQSAKMDEIIALSKTINPLAVAAEILDWLIANVEEYIDNSDTIYRIYFTPDAIQEGTDASKLQALYMAIPETGHVKEVECIDALHEVEIAAKEAMDNDETRLGKLFQRLVFYYDTKVARVGNDIRAVTTEMDGKITLSEFLWDTVGQKVKIVRKNVELTREEHARADAKELIKQRLAQGKFKEVVTEIDQPAGFSVEMEISYWPKTVAAQ